MYGDVRTTALPSFVILKILLLKPFFFLPELEFELIKELPLHNCHLVLSLHFTRADQNLQPFKGSPNNTHT
jgi:hypothetical protein